MKSSFSTIYANGDIGGIAGQNKGTITTSSSYAKITYYYVDGNARSIGGIVGYNSGGTVTQVNQYGAIYNAQLGDRPIELYAKIGTIIGHNEGYFDNVGNRGSWDIHWIVVKGIWGNVKNDYGDYILKKQDKRVGKE